MQPPHLPRRAHLCAARCSLSPNGRGPLTAAPLTAALPPHTHTPASVTAEWGAGSLLARRVAVLGAGGGLTPVISIQPSMLTRGASSDGRAFFCPSFFTVLGHPPPMFYSVLKYVKKLTATHSLKGSTLIKFHTGI